MLGIIALIIALLAAVCSAQAATVCRVYDGDSLKLVGLDGRCTGPSIRLHGVDAPERRPPPGTRARRPIDKRQPFALASRDYLARLTLGRSVGLLCDGSASHKRRVCRVTVGGLDVGQELIRAGLAYHGAKYTTGAMAADYRTAQAQAKALGLGLWALPYGGERPWNYRARLRAKR